MNMTGGKESFDIPSPESGKKWVRIVDTQYYFETDFNCWDEKNGYVENNTSYGVDPWSVVIFKEVKQ